jgi:ribosomal protein S12 methylthiotransferase
MPAKRPTHDAPVVCLVSLGCAKNTVDSERILGALVQDGFLVAEDPADADLCLVNTCGFIHDAREESAGVLRDLRRLKSTGRLKAVAALGCLVERAAGADELNGFLDAADVRIGFADYPRLAALCRAALNGGHVAAAAAPGVPVAIGDRRAGGAPGRAAPSFTESYAAFLAAPRLRVGSPHLAYLKISEGCSNFCRFCSIPYIRGVQASRPEEDIVAEARQLLEGGTREIGLIAQDTTSYGRDLGGEYRLPALLRRLGALDGDFWLRVMYVFPRFLTDEMLDTFAAEPRICRYIDIPLQHIADRMLSLMGRGMGRDETAGLLERIRARIPGVAVRTTFIVGHPGETEQDFDELKRFVAEAGFSHVGVFLYSPEPRTPSARMADEIPLAEKKRRRDELMRTQLEVSRRLLRARVGGVEEIMVDGHPARGAAAPPGAAAVGRSRAEAPEVDGLVFLAGRPAKRLRPGEVVRARITDSLDYDLVADPLGPGGGSRSAIPGRP